MDMSDSHQQTAQAADITVHIDRIVLVGVDPRDRSAVGAAVESEMTRLFTDRAWRDAPVASGGLERLDAGAFTYPLGARDGELGAQIGVAVHGGLTR